MWLLLVWMHPWKKQWLKKMWLKKKVKKVVRPLVSCFLYYQMRFFFNTHSPKYWDLLLPWVGTIEFGVQTMVEANNVVWNVATTIVGTQFRGMKRVTLSLWRLVEWLVKGGWMQPWLLNFVFVISCWLWLMLKITMKSHGISTFEKLGFS